MERSAMEKLRQWKNRQGRKPLIIRGARQVGKTWLMKEFGKTCFEKTAYINFDNNARMQQVFQNDFDIERIVLALSIESGITITPEYAIIAAGSLLGVALHKGTSFPVGKVEFLNLYPLSYQEFLRAVGDSSYAALLDNNDQELLNAFHTKYIERLREHDFVGGMPEAVASFISNKNFQEVRQIQKNLLSYYQQDFSKHAQTSLVPRLNLVWNSIPMQLAKENKKYIYGQVREGARAKDFKLAIQWLLDCGLIHKVPRVSKPSLPLKAYQDLDAKIVIEGNRIFTEFKGALTEQYVLQQLMAELNVEPGYYSTANSSGEIDFFLQGSTSVIPVEVKAEENLRAKSLKAFYEKFKPQYSVRTSMSPYREQDWMVNIPLYQITTLKKFLDI